MQAIILAAGMGKRLGSLTKDNTKCMVEVNGIKLIDRMLESLSNISLNRVIIVVGYQADNLINHIGKRYDDKLHIEFITNKIYDKTNNIYSLALASKFLCEDDTILLESDLIFEDKMLQLLVDHSDKNLALVAKYESWMDGTMVCIDNDRRILNFVPKAAFRYEDVNRYYKTVNIYKFSKEFSSNLYVPFLEAYCKVMGNNEYYEQVLGVLLQLHNSDLKALPITNEQWYEIDDVQDLDIASTLFSDGKVKYNEYHKRYGGYWRFPQLLDYCYLVNPFFPPKRMKDEIKANFDALIGNYPSGMLVNSMLAGKYFGINQEYVVVGNGAAELIKNVMESHIQNRIGIIFPTFDEYPNRLSPDQIVAFVPDSNDFSYSADELISFFGRNTVSSILLVNPDNPSGHFMPICDVLRLADWCLSKQIQLIVDESFVDFTDNFRENSLLSDSTLERFPNLVVIKSISKSYGVPGLRLGILASSDCDLISGIKKEVGIWNINSFAEFYLQIFGKYQNDYYRACEEFIKERELFYNDLKSIPFLHVIPSQANYFLCKLTNKYSSTELTQILIEQDVLVNNCSLKRNMAGSNVIRISIRNRTENEQLVSILRQL